MLSFIILYPTWGGLHEYSYSCAPSLSPVGDRYPKNLELAYLGYTSCHNVAGAQGQKHMPMIISCKQTETLVPGFQIPSVILLGLQIATNW